MLIRDFLGSTFRQRLYPDCVCQNTRNGGVNYDAPAAAGRQSLRSASRGDVVVPHTRTAIKQHRAFAIVGPSIWNSLPPEIRFLPRDLSSSFYKFLKTIIFARAWAGSASE